MTPAGTFGLNLLGRDQIGMAKRLRDLGPAEDGYLIAELTR